MNLSSDLISQFVKVTNDKTETKKESTVYGTAVEHDGAMYVKIDGSELLTPVETTTDMKNGERVTVMIKNHTATVTGNISSPAARTDTVKEVDGKVKEVSDQISDFEIVVADKVSTKELDAEKARIDELKADNVTINEKLTANEAYISEIEAENVKINGKLEASEAEIETIKAEKLDVTSANAKYATIENLDATNAEVYNFKGTYGEFVDLTTEKFEAAEANIEKLNTEKLSVADADIKYADIDELDAANAKITNLESDYGDFKDLTAENFKAVNANIENADLKYANIDFSNIGKATMQYFYAQSGLIKDVTVGDQTITGHLVGVTISGDLIEGNTIKAEKLVIKGSDGLYYQLNTDGMVTEAEQTDENSLNGSIIKAKSITATKISVQDLVAFGATIGGFKITDNSIYSGVKETVGNNTRGIYLDNDGQIAFGDSSNYVKFYKNASGNYKLAIAADELLLEGSNIGSEVSSLKSKVPWVTDVWVDATAYDESLWIPFVGDPGLATGASTRIYVNAALNGNSHPSWATHANGFSVGLEVEDIGNGWGINLPNTRIHIDTFNWCSSSPVSYTQLTYGSKPILYLRGGGKYRVKTSREITWTAFPDGYTWTSGQYSQSAPTHTSRPTPVGTNLYSDMAKAKSKIDQQADSITAVVAKANQNESDIASLKLTNDAFEVRFGTVEGNVDDAIDKATQAQESFDNLEVGGRNYLTNAKRLNNWTLISGTAGTCNRNHAECPNGVYLIAGNSSNDTHYRLSNVITSNGYWTISFEIKGSQSTAVGFYLDICDLGRTRILTNNKNTWEKRSLTVNVTNYTSDVYHFVDFENISWAYIFIRNLKIEKGTKATDYTPAPEDVDSAIDSAQSTADTALGNANLAQSTADGVKTDLANNYTKKTLPDTRNDNQNPQWYMTNYPKQIITEFKYTYVVGLSGESYCALTTTVPWNDASGGYPKQVAKVGNKEYWRVGTSTTAWGPWNDPAATATNYMKFENNTGLVIGDMTASTLGRNVLIDSDSVDIRLGETVLASYGDNRISLGANNITSIIDLCSGTGQITASALDAGSEWWQLQLRSQNSIGLISGGEIIMNTDYSDGEWEVHNSFSMGADLPWNNETYCYSYWSVSANSSSAYYQSSVDLDQNKVGITHMGLYGISTLTLDDESITLDATDTKVTGAMKFTTNNARIWGTTTDGTEVEVFQAKNSSNNTVIGWGNYDGNAGNTNVYGNNVMVRSKKDVTVYADGGNAILRSDSDSLDGYSKVYGPEVYIHPVNTHTSFRPYYHGVDSFTTIFRGAGYLTSSGKSVYFAIPLAKPVVGNVTVSVTTTNGFVLRQNNSYTHGSAYASSGYTYAKPTSYNASIDGSGSYILVNATFSVNTNATNNSPIGIDWTGKVTFAYG